MMIMRWPLIAVMTMLATSAIGGWESQFDTDLFTDARDGKAWIKSGDALLTAWCREDEDDIWLMISPLDVTREGTRLGVMLARFDDHEPRELTMLVDAEHSVARLLGLYLDDMLIFDTLALRSDVGDVVIDLDDFGSALDEACRWHEAYGRAIRSVDDYWKNIEYFEELNNKE